MTHVGYVKDVGSGDPPIDTGITGHLHKPAPKKKTLWVGLDVPVFEGYYNEDTDIASKPSGLSKPTVEIKKSDTARWHPDGVDLGAEIKVQVTNVYKP
jgi:hypothetical protein